MTIWLWRKSSIIRNSDTVCFAGTLRLTVDGLKELFFIRTLILTRTLCWFEGYLHGNVVKKFDVQEICFEGNLLSSGNLTLLQEICGVLTDLDGALTGWRKSSYQEIWLFTLLQEICGDVKKFDGFDGVAGNLWLKEIFSLPGTLTACPIGLSNRPVSFWWFYFSPHWTMLTTDSGLNYSLSNSWPWIELPNSTDDVDWLPTDGWTDSRRLTSNGLE